MAFLVGADEAGYGPNLGPLVVAASVWRLSSSLSLPASDPNDDQSPNDELYSRLSDIVDRQPNACDRIAIADSKQLYRPGGDVQHLERGIFAALESLIKEEDQRPSSFRDLCQFLCPEAITQLPGIPWYAHYDVPLPIAAKDAARLTRETMARWHDTLQRQGVQLIALRTRIVFPAAFNMAVERLGSKGALLSGTTLDLVADLVSELPREPVQIVCDKHGGRNKYGPLLQPRFGDRLVRVITEGRRLSRYDIGTADQSIRISFQVGGESFLPSALASMTAKYVRELAMKAFNTFWQGHVSDLRPTAGYPVDAKRFKQDIAAAQERLQIDDNMLWRRR